MENIFTPKQERAWHKLLFDCVRYLSYKKDTYKILEKILTSNKTPYEKILDIINKKGLVRKNTDYGGLLELIAKSEHLTEDIIMALCRNTTCCDSNHWWILMRQKKLNLNHAMFLVNAGVDKYLTTQIGPVIVAESHFLNEEIISILLKKYTLRNIDINRMIKIEQGLLKEKKEKYKREFDVRKWVTCSLMRNEKTPVELLRKFAPMGQKILTDLEGRGSIVFEQIAESKNCPLDILTSFHNFLEKRDYFCYASASSIKRLVERNPNFPKNKILITT